MTGGGGLTKRTVSVYGVKGWEGDLPDLLEGRHGHACASYMKRGKRVMIVAGGTADLQGLYSTEILTMGAKAWTTVTPLPRYLKYPRMVTLNNKVYITGTERLYKNRVISQIFLHSYRQSFKHNTNFNHLFSIYQPHEQLGNSLKLILF